MDENNKYQALFFEETDEYLDILNDRILILEENPHDGSLIDEIFRAAHTLKGMAATMGYDEMAGLTHSMENVLELFRSGTMEVNTNIISLIFECLDKLSEIVEDLRAGNSGKIDVSELIKKLEAVEGNDKYMEETKDDKDSSLGAVLSDSDYLVIGEAREKGYEAYDIKVTISEDCTLKGPRAFLIVTKLEDVGELVATFPHIEDLEKGEYEDDFRLICISKSKVETVQSIVENNAEIEAVEIKIVSEKCEESQVEEEVEDKAKEQRTRPIVTSSNQSIRVQLDKLDSFMNLVSELVIYRTRLEDITSRFDSTEIAEPLDQVSKITSDLQDLVLSIRMEAVNVVFNRFPRMIRDLSQELDKDIDLIIEGEDTELDRTVVSELGEPLVHLIRNAADHGIESREDRVKLGKPETGTIDLKAYQEGNRVVILVADDGKGVDPKVIKKSAEKKGIDTSGLSDQDLIELIFDKGFSTNTDVTSVSGRGVGMDVVRQKIATLGGSISVTSKVNEGSTFVIKLPLSLLIIQALLVKIGQETFAISLEIIERVISMRESDIKKSHLGEVYILEDETIPILRLGDRFGLESDKEDKHLILISVNGKRYGVIVDDFIGQQDIVIKELGKSFKNMKDFIGATILGSGDIILIVDIISIINSTEGDMDDE